MRKYAERRRELHLLSGRFAICRLEADAPPPSRPAETTFWSVTVEHEDTTLVCDQEFAPAIGQIEQGWCGIRVAGEISFSEIGVLAKLAAPLAAASVSVYAVSTYRTDYLFVREADLERALDVLGESGFQVRSESEVSA